MDQWNQPADELIDSNVDEGFLEEKVDSTEPVIVTCIINECEDCYVLLLYPTCTHRCPGEPLHDDEGFDDREVLINFANWISKSRNGYTRIHTISTGEQCFL